MILLRLSEARELSTQVFLFPKWTNHARFAVAAIAVVGVPYLALLAAYGASPEAIDVGYQPVQPIAFQHLLHAGELGMDCRYCHNTVEVSKHASIPPTQTCLNCHSAILPNSEKLVPLLESAHTGMPVEWVRVHDLPDFVYFNHSAHINKGVGCVSCHGRIDKMDVVYQDKPLSMGWCLDCHRRPENHLRPLDEITNMTYQPAGGDQLAIGLKLKEEYNIRPAQYMTSCSVCHR